MAVTASLYLRLDHGKITHVDSTPEKITAQGDALVWAGYKPLPTHIVVNFEDFEDEAQMFGYAAGLAFQLNERWSQCGSETSGD